MSAADAILWQNVIFDAQAVSLWLNNDRAILGRLTLLRRTQTRILVCANTLIELAAHPRHRGLAWLASFVLVEPVTAQLAMDAGDLLRKARLTGHNHAIDASVAALALQQTGATAIMTSDPDDMYQLCGDQIDIVTV